MRHISTTRTIHVLAIVACLSFTSVASATSTHRYPSPTYRAVNIELLPTVSFFGTLNTSTPIFLGTLFVPIQTPTLLSRQSGGDHDGGGNDDDTTGDNDTINGGGGHGDNDSTDNDNGGGHHGNDSTDVDDDSTGNDGHHGGDSTDGNGHDSNDTLECGGHGHHDGTGDNDSVEVSDTSNHSMFKGGRQSIVIKTSSQKTFVTFKFTNDLTTKVAVTHFALTNGTNFSIASAMPTVAKPINVAAGASISVKVSFSAQDAMRHTDQLQISSSGSTTPSVISLEGIKINATASVSTNVLPAGVSVTMSPNPMSSILKINVNGARNTAVAIYDMLGKQIFTQNINADFQWNGYSNDNMLLANGTFIARLSGESTEGKTFVISQKIMLQR